MEKMKIKENKVFYGKKGKIFGVKFVNFNLIEKIEICIQIISSGMFEFKADNIEEEKT